MTTINHHRFEQIDSGHFIIDGNHYAPVAEEDHEIYVEEHGPVTAIYLDVYSYGNPNMVLKYEVVTDFYESSGWDEILNRNPVGIYRA